MSTLTSLDRMVLFAVAIIFLIAASTLSYSDAMCAESNRGACGAVNKELCSASS